MPQDIASFVAAALAEDIGRGDLFAHLAPKDALTAFIKTKEDGILAGCIYAEKLCEIAGIKAKFLKSDGETISANETLLRLYGDAAAILSAERTLLNMFQHASGIATNVAKYANKLKGYDTLLLDTRKTRPLLRVFEKYAARVGGATNHRMGLDDCLMLKDTHLAAITDLSNFIQQARKSIPFTAKIEVESESFEAATEAMRCGADIVMCDNLPSPLVAKIVEYKKLHYPNTLVEASGGINIENIEEYAKTGVDAISVGGLIHQAVWLDFSMKCERNRPLA